MENRIYFAYGSNINRRQMAHRCPDAKVLGTGYIDGQELKFKSVATIEPGKNIRVPVLAWSISQADEDSLDGYEGFPNKYIKKTFEAQIGEQKTTGMAYVMNKFRPLTTPSAAYFNTIAEGYRTAGMDASYLNRALKNARRVQEETPLFYIAYGSNTNQKQMASRCPGANPVARGILPGYKLEFKKYATISPSENDGTPVVIWRLAPGNERALDVYEGFPSFYQKEYFQYRIGNETHTAMAYIMSGNHQLEPPSETYYEGVLAGYRRFGLDESVLETALDAALEFEESQSECAGGVQLEL